MPTALLAPATAAANSADVTVTATAPVSLGLYTAAGGGIEGGISAMIARKNPAGTYQATGLVLTSAVKDLVVAAPGVYQVQKPVTVAAVGIVSDT